MKRAETNKSTRNGISSPLVTLASTENLLSELGVEPVNVVPGLSQTQKIQVFPGSVNARKKLRLEKLQARKKIAVQRIQRKLKQKAENLPRISLKRTEDYIH